MMVQVTVQCAQLLCCHVDYLKQGGEAPVTFSLCLWSYFEYLSTIWDVINTSEPAWSILPLSHPSTLSSRRAVRQNHLPITVLPPGCLSPFPCSYPGSFRNSVKILLRLCFIFPWMLIIFTCLIKDSRAFP